MTIFTKHELLKIIESIEGYKKVYSISVADSKTLANIVEKIKKYCEHS